jgi:transcriptional regulator with XRE-family HTH domain
MTQLGEKIRTRRHELSKTLKDVAEATGLSIGLLSQVERNLTIPSLSSLAILARTLDVSIGELAGHLIEPHPDTYHDQRVPYTLDHGEVRYERLSSVFSGSALHSVKFIMPPGYRSETVSHDGEEMIYVLRGRIRYRVAEKQYVLETGDSLHFSAQIPHSIEALKSEFGPAEVIWSGTLNIFGDTAESIRHGEADALEDTEFNDRQRT